MDDCTEPTRWLPDALADDSPDNSEEFLAHIEACAYHRARLAADEEELRDAFRLAKLFGSGRVLEGDELGRTVTAARQQLERWDEAAPRRELPFKRIALYNGRHPIASCNQFLSLNKHVVVLKLDAEAGLEVRGIVAGGGRSAKARLCVYPLVGVSHTGEKAFDLKNGYTVGLKVEELGGETYKIEFRCVETRRLGTERIGDDSRGGVGVTSSDGGMAGVGSGWRPPIKHLPLPSLSDLFRVGGASCFGLLIASLIIAALPRVASHVPAGTAAIRAYLSPAPPGNQTGLAAVRAGVLSPAGFKPQSPPTAGAGAPKAEGSQKARAAGAASSPGQSQPTHQLTMASEKGAVPDAHAKRGAGYGTTTDKARVAKIMLDYSGKRTPATSAGDTTRAVARNGTQTSPRRVLNPKQTVLLALDTRTPAGKVLVAFTVAQPGNLLRSLEGEVKGMKEQGVKVLDVAEVQKESADRKLMSFDLTVVNQAKGKELLFRARINDKPYAESYPLSRANTAARGASLKNALSSVFKDIKAGLRHSTARDEGEAVHHGGGNADAWIPLEVQMEVQRSHYRRDATNGPGVYIIGGRLVDVEHG